MRIFGVCSNCGLVTSKEKHCIESNSVIENAVELKEISFEIKKRVIQAKRRAVLYRKSFKNESWNREMGKLSVLHSLEKIIATEQEKTSP